MIDFINQSSGVFTLLISVLAGLFALVKWLDSRNIQLQQERFNTYMQLVGVISGKRQDSSTPNYTEQIAAVWFLIEYKEYYHITRKIFSNNDFEKLSDVGWVQNIAPHIQIMLKDIS